MNVSTRLYQNPSKKAKIAYEKHTFQPKINRNTEQLLQSKLKKQQDEDKREKQSHPQININIKESNKILLNKTNREIDEIFGQIRNDELSDIHQIVCYFFFQMGLVPEQNLNQYQTLIDQFILVFGIEVNVKKRIDLGIKQVIKINDLKQIYTGKEQILVSNSQEMLDMHQELVNENHQVMAGAVHTIQAHFQQFSINRHDFLGKL